MTAARPLPATAPRDERSRVLAQAAIAPGHFRLRLQAPYIARSAAPGQFVQVRASDGLDPFLRRPLSVALAAPDEGWIELVYKVVGFGTEALSRRAPGEEISTLGPLGHPFRLGERGTVFLVGGGVGMPPLRFAAHRLPADRVRVVQGAQTKSLLLFDDEFERLGVGRHSATEDGSAGVRGLVTDALAPALDSARGEAEILTCGPLPMMAAVAQAARARGLPCQVSLEERMACGFGVCMGCAVRRAGRPEDSPRYALVCTEGPVFEAEEVFSPVGAAYR